MLVLVWTGGGLGRASGRLARAESGGRGMGLTLAAAMERESRLSAAASFCRTVSTMGGRREERTYIHNRDGQLRKETLDAHHLYPRLPFLAISHRLLAASLFFCLLAQLFQ